MVLPGCSTGFNIPNVDQAWLWTTRVKVTDAKPDLSFSNGSEVMKLWQSSVWCDIWLASKWKKVKQYIITSLVHNNCQPDAKMQDAGHIFLNPWSLSWYSMSYRSAMKTLWCTSASNFSNEANESWGSPQATRVCGCSLDSVMVLMTSKKAKPKQKS